MLKLCLLTFYTAYTQSLISNTPYRVLKVFHLRANLEIQEKSPPNRIRNRFAFDVVSGIISWSIFEPSGAPFWGQFWQRELRQPIPHAQKRSTANWILLACASVVLGESIFGTPLVPSGPYMRRYVEIGRHYYGKWGSPFKTLLFLIDFGFRFDAHGRWHAKISRRHYGK